MEFMTTYKAPPTLRALVAVGGEILTRAVKRAVLELTRQVSVSS